MPVSRRTLHFTQSSINYHLTAPFGPNSQPKEIKHHFASDGGKKCLQRKKKKKKNGPTNILFSKENLTDRNNQFMFLQKICFLFCETLTKNKYIQSELWISYSCFYCAKLTSNWEISGPVMIEKHFGTNNN